MFELFFHNPEPHALYEELQKKVYLTPDAIQQKFSIPKDLVLADFQKQNPKPEAVFLGDKKIVERLARAGVEAPPQQANLAAISNLCEKICSMWWQEIAPSHLAFVNAAYDGNSTIDTCFELQDSFYQKVHALDSLIDELSLQIAAVRGIKPAANTPTT